MDEFFKFSSLLLSGILLKTCKKSINIVVTICLNNLKMYPNFGGLIGILITIIPIRIFKWGSTRLFMLSSVVSFLTITIYVPALLYLPCGNVSVDGIFDVQNKKVFSSDENSFESG